MVAASKSWQKGKISTWPGPRGGRGPWSKYKAVVLGVSGAVGYQERVLWDVRGISLHRGSNF